MPPELQDSISNHFLCPIGEFPAKYLGLPLSIRKITASFLQPFVERLEKKLSPWWASMLSRGKRLALIRHVLCAMPTHILIAMSLHPSILRQVNRLLHAFLWQGRKTTNEGHCLVNWAKVCRPLAYGGLGIPCWKYALEAIIKWVLLYFLVHDNCLFFML